MWKRESGIMLAMDVEDKQSAFSLLDEIYELIDVIKFNYPLVLREGIALLREIKNRYEKPIFADFKVADVPVTNNRIIKLCQEYGADAVMIHGFVGVEALHKAINTATDCELFLVTQLTNPGGADFFEPFSEKFAEIASTLELGGVQAPGNRPEVIEQVREIIGPEKTIVSCGIGAQGGRFGGAIQAGADFEIIGRAIYQAEQPVEKVKQIRTKITPHL